MRICVPPPQEAVHSLGADQGVTSQSTSGLVMGFTSVLVSGGSCGTGGLFGRSIGGSKPSGMRSGRRTDTVPTNMTKKSIKANSANPPDIPTKTEILCFVFPILSQGDIVSTNCVKRKCVLLFVLKKR